MESSANHKLSKDRLHNRNNEFNYVNLGNASIHVEKALEVTNNSANVHN